MIRIKSLVIEPAVDLFLFFITSYKRTFPDTVTNSVFTNSFPRFSMTSLKAYLIIWRQDYRKEKGKMALEIVTDGKNDKPKKNY